jgi:hypothetical protein
VFGADRRLRVGAGGNVPLAPPGPERL